MNPDEPKTPEPNQTPSSEQITPPDPKPSNPFTILSKFISRRGETPPGEPMDRRSFLKLLFVGWAAFTAVVVGYGSMILRYLFPNVLFEPKQSFEAGLVSDYTVGEVSERFKKQHGVWIVRDPEKIYALSTVCTHLGCTPNWQVNDNKFKCPCHGSGYYKTGINFEGPAPRPLERFKIYLSPEGEIVVDKTEKFQQEKGEWGDPSSYILT